MTAKKLFISYSHADLILLERLKVHLKPLERQGFIAPWFDGYLLPGDDIDVGVSKALDYADIVVLLVSPDFLASDYCFTIEMESALSSHKNNECRVIPVIVRDCLWHQAPFGRLVALPTDAKAFMSLHWPDKDEAWRIAAEGIHAAATAIDLSPQSESPSFSATSPSTAPAAISEEARVTFPIPRKRQYSDKERDDFKHEAFETIARRFEASLDALKGELAGTFRQLDANRFTSAIYLEGKKKSGITVWVGGQLRSGAISFYHDDSGETRSTNGEFSIEIGNEGLSLVDRMHHFGSADDKHLSPDKAAEYLWGKFVDKLSER